MKSDEILKEILEDQSNGAMTEEFRDLIFRYVEARKEEGFVSENG